MKVTLMMTRKLIDVGAIKQEGDTYTLVNVETGEVYSKSTPFTSIQEVEDYIIAHLYVRTELKKMLEHFS